MISPNIKIVDKVELFQMYNCFYNFIKIPWIFNDSKMF